MALNKCSQPARAGLCIPLSIHGDLIAHVHPSVKEPVYRDPDGMRLRAPSDPLASPSPELLQKRLDFAQGRLRHRGLEPHRV